MSSLQWRKAFLDYIEREGFVLGRSEFVDVPLDYVLKKENNERFLTQIKEGDTHRIVEIRHEVGLCNDYEARSRLNYLFYSRASAALAPWPWSVKRPPFLKNHTYKGEHFEFDKDRTTVYLGGCFPMMIYKEKEESLRDLCFNQGFDHCRMISYFFNEPWGRHKVLMSMVKGQKKGK
jgi:hypothetical protein